MRTLAYTPSREPRDALVARTVARTDVLARIAASIDEAADSDARTHLLLVGPRGSGKSHVLQVAIAEAAERRGDDDRLVFVTVPEDAIGFSRLDDLLERALVALGDRPGSRLSTSTRKARVAELLGERRLVLLVENLDRVLSAFGEEGQHAFRSWVEESGNVLVLATAPVFFAGVKNKGKAWSDTFEVMRLPGLDADEGHDLLARLAAYDGDTELVDFLATDRGRARVRAIAELTGGSPRIWMVLRDCLTPRSLDQLLPAVEDLLEDLTPYYQQQLWELPPRHQRVVRALAEGRASTMSAAEIGRAAGETRGTSALLRRLAEDQWVERVEMGEPGHRRSWWSLREPLLRHHFQYRSGSNEALTLMVTFLRLAFEPGERRRQLARTTPDSTLFAQVAESFAGESRRADAAYADHDVDALQGEARLWMRDEGPWSYAASGRAVDEVVSRSREEVRASAGSDDDLARLVGQRLEQAASEAPDERTRKHLALIARCWTPSEPFETAATLNGLLTGLDSDDPLAMLVREESAYWTGVGGDNAAARDQYANLVGDRTRVLGHDHPDTLRSRRHHAMQTALSGDPERARDLLAHLIDDQSRILGSDHPDTLAARLRQAQLIADDGEHLRARDLLAGLVEDQAAVLGPDHPDTLRGRRDHAQQIGRVGDAAGARDRLAALIEDQTRVSGPDAPQTLSVRHHHAYQTGEAGDHTRARELYVALIADQSRILGPDHPDTLRSRHNEAYQAGESGDHAAARDLYAALVDDRTRLLGRDHPDTVRSRRNHAFETGESGDHATARDLYAELLREADASGSGSDEDRRFLRLNWAISQAAADPTGSLRASFGQYDDPADLGEGDESGEGGDPGETAVVEAPDEDARSLLSSIALENALTAGTPTGIPLVDLVIEAKRGSEEALTRLPEELRNALPLLPEPPTT